ncbi:50S ribosomal protein L22 [Candidatus Parcubacteria bacterium]|nr:MAG: 50S ribosomal protein L22 [Candidatus Parcubacteria bacterium]
MEVKAKLKSIRISSKKMALVAGAIRGLAVPSALDKLPVINKKSAPVLEKLLKSAVANVIDRYDNVKAEDLIIKSVIVNKAMDIKRWRPAAFGRAHPFRKRSSHVEISLTVKEGVKAVLRDKKKAEVETVDLTKKDKPAVAKTEKKATTKKTDKKKEVKKAEGPEHSRGNKKEEKAEAKKDKVKKDNK